MGTSCPGRIHIISIGDENRKLLFDMNSAPLFHADHSFSAPHVCIDSSSSLHLPSCRYTSESTIEIKHSTHAVELATVGIGVGVGVEVSVFRVELISGPCRQRSEQRTQPRWGHRWTGRCCKHRRSSFRGWQRRWPCWR